MVGGGYQHRTLVCTLENQFVGGKFCHDARCIEDNVKLVSVIIQAVKIGRICKVIYI